ncbi:MAG: MFS transporter [Burkholderiales bacterium]|nr:MFS transporter [Burkholderiales bacterium]
MTRPSPRPAEIPSAVPAARGAVLALGCAQTLAWASSYYLPAILARPIAREIGFAPPTLFALFSGALLVSALAGPLAGRLIDRHGGRPVLMASNGLFAAGLALMALAHSLAGLALAWGLMGLAMGAGLYDAAFAALVRLYGRESRQAITGITLIAGFASTVGWPLTTLFLEHLGWRGACAAWAGLHLVLALPLNARLPRQRAAAVAIAVPAAVPGGAQGAVQGVGDIAQSAPADPPPPPPATGPLLALLFTMLGFVSTAMAAHLPGLLHAGGASVSVALLAGALIGPAQVAARLLEFGVLRRRSPLVSARVATLTHPLAAVVLLVLGGAGALPFALLHGAGNGLLTIVRGTLPLALFGSAGYGARQGWLGLPARLVGSLAPWLFGLALARWGVQAVWLSAAMCGVAFACLLPLRAPPPAPTAPPAPPAPEAPGPAVA